MKKLILLSAFAFLGLASCKKEEKSGYVVKYSVICDSCTMITKAENNRQMSFAVKEFSNYSDFASADNDYVEMKIIVDKRQNIKYRVTVNDFKKEDKEIRELKDSLTVKIKLK